MKTKIIDGWEYTTEDLEKGKSFTEIEIPEGWQLWTYEDCVFLHNNHREELNLEDCWFHIEQPFNFNKEKDYVARFSANSDWALLGCDRDPAVRYGWLGVRFKRKVLSKKENKLLNDYKKELDALLSEFDKKIEKTRQKFMEKL